MYLKSCFEIDIHDSLNNFVLKILKFLKFYLLFKEIKKDDIKIKNLKIYRN